MAVVMPSKHGPLYLPITTLASPWDSDGEKRRGFRDPWVIPADWYINQNGDAVPAGWVETALLSYWSFVKEIIVHDPRDEILHCRCGQHRRPDLGALLDEAVAAKREGRVRRLFIDRSRKVETSGTMPSTT